MPLTFAPVVAGGVLLLGCGQHDVGQPLIPCRRSIFSSTTLSIKPPDAGGELLLVAEGEEHAHRELLVQHQQRTDPHHATRSSPKKQAVQRREQQIQLALAARSAFIVSTTRLVKRDRRSACALNSLIACNPAQRARK